MLTRLCSRLRSFTCLLATLITFLGTCYSLALNKETIYFEPIMGYEELPNLVVNVVLQDQHGFIWVGTNDGLVRYDGNTYKVFKYSSNSPGSIASKRITSLGESPDGTLWVSTYDGLCRYNEETEDFTSYLLHDEEDVSLTPGGDVMEFDSEGNIILGTVTGMPIFNPSTETWDLSYTEQGNFETFLKDIQKMEKDRFLLAATTGFFEFDRKNGKLTQLKQSPRHENGQLIEGRSVLHDSQERLWMGTINHGVYVYDKDGKPLKFSVTDQDKELNDFGTVRYIEEDAEGNIWVGFTFEGIAVLPVDGTEMWFFANDSTDTQTLPGQIFMDLAQTRDKQLLFATDGNGIFRYDSKRQNFEFYKYVRGRLNALHVSPVVAATEGPDGTIWMTDGTRRVNKFAPLTRTFSGWLTRESPINNIRDRIISFAINNDNVMYIAGRSKGLFRFDIETSHLEKVEYQMASGQAPPRFSRAKIVFDSHGWLWILGNDIFRLNTETNVIEKVGNAPDLVHKTYSPRSIYENDSGDLWFGTRGNGFFFYSREKDELTEDYRPDLNPELLKDATITGIYQSDEEFLWITSQSGIGRFNLKTKLFDTPSYVAPVSSKAFYGLQGDEQGNLWASSAEGLVRIIPSQQNFQYYDKYDGLWAVDFTNKPFLKLKSGLMLIGGQNGINLFAPKNIHERPKPGGVNITNFIASSHSYERRKTIPAIGLSQSRDSIELDYDYNFLEILYASVTPGKYETYEYAYRLVGLQSDWYFAGKNKRATFTNLNPGDYVFEVKARNKDNVWNENVTRMKISILPPYYQTIWFRASMVALFGILFVSAVRFRTYRIKDINRRLARQVFHRTRDLEESRNEALDAKREADLANKAKSTFLATVSHEIRTPMNGVLGMASLLKNTELTEDQKTYLNAINTSGSTLMNIINDILDFSKMEAGEFKIYCRDMAIRDCIESVVSLFQADAGKQDIAMEIEVDEIIP